FPTRRSSDLLVHSLDTQTHSVLAETLLLGTRKSDADVLDDQNYILARPFQQYIHLRGLGMLYDIVQSLLRYSIKVRFDIAVKPKCREPRGMNARRNGVVTRPFLYKGVDRIQQPEFVERSRPKLPRQETELGIEHFRDLLQTRRPGVKLRIFRAHFAQRRDLQPKRR